MLTVDYRSYASPRDSVVPAKVFAPDLVSRVSLLFPGYITNSSNLQMPTKNSLRCHLKLTLGGVQSLLK